MVMNDIVTALDELDNWMKPEKVIQIPRYVQNFQNNTIMKIYPILDIIYRDH